MSQHHDAERLAESIGQQVSGRVEDFAVRVTPGGLVLSGRAHTVLARALVEVEAARISGRPVLRNEIEVTPRAARRRAATPPATPPAGTARSSGKAHAD